LFSINQTPTNTFTASAKNKKKKNKKKAGATTVAENKQNNVNGSAEIHALDDEDPAEDDPESPVISTNLHQA